MWGVGHGGTPLIAGGKSQGMIRPIGWPWDPGWALAELRRFVDYKLERQSSVALDPSNLAILEIAFAGQLV